MKQLDISRKKTAEKITPVILDNHSIPFSRKTSITRFCRAISRNWSVPLCILITACSEQVKNGVSLVCETGKALKEILIEVQQINTNVTAMVESVKEQALGLKEINQAVNTMAQGTQQNAAMVEKFTAASHTLESEAEGLVSLLSAFKVGKAYKV